MWPERFVSGERSRLILVASSTVRAKNPFREGWRHFAIAQAARWAYKIVRQATFQVLPT